MKKAILFSAVLFLVSAICISTAAAEEKQYKYPYQESALSYRNVTVYKVLDQKDAYVVMHQKGHREIGNVVIPKKWYKEQPKKLAFRALSKGMTPYMTVIYRDGKFDQVILTMPTSRADSSWGVADSNVQVNADTDTLDIVY